MRPGTIWIVIPAYNEGLQIKRTIQDLQKHEFQKILVVDDGSSDATAQQARSAGVQLIQHRHNRGQGAALQTGFDYVYTNTDAEVIVTFDADGQHRAQDIAALVAPVLAGQADIALGSRFLQADSTIPLGRYILLKLAVGFTRIVTRLPVTDAHNGLRALSRAACQKIRLQQPRMEHASEILDEIRRRRLRFVEVPVRIVYSDYARAKGQRDWAFAAIGARYLVGRYKTGGIREPAV